MALLREEYNAILDRRMNDILYVLTMVTTVIVPMQTLTGIYGMNFVDSENNPTMPELTWKWGYTYFWVLSITLIPLLLLMSENVSSPLFRNSRELHFQFET